VQECNEGSILQGLGNENSIIHTGIDNHASRLLPFQASRLTRSIFNVHGNQLITYIHYLIGTWLAHSWFDMSKLDQLCASHTNKLKHQSLSTALVLLVPGDAHFTMVLLHAQPPSLSIATADGMAPGSQPLLHGLLRKDKVGVLAKPMLRSCELGLEYGVLVRKPSRTLNRIRQKDSERLPTVQTHEFVRGWWWRVARRVVGKDLVHLCLDVKDVCLRAGQWQLGVCCLP
jgi:hypothetical protein